MGVADSLDASALERSLKAASQIVWLTQCPEEPAGGGAKDPNVEALNLVCAHPARAGRKIVLLSSGGSVYGPPGSLPVAEIHPHRPLGAYGLSKKRLEDSLTQNIERIAGLSFDPD
jgi:UDP-glucose 4-epimerase